MFTFRVGSFWAQDRFEKMFKKLKEKITEEVKSSPQRFAEFTQSVSDRLQNSSTSDDNFFSIGDDGIEVEVIL